MKIKLDKIRDTKGSCWDFKYACENSSKIFIVRVTNRYLFSKGIQSNDKKEVEKFAVNLTSDLEKKINNYEVVNDCNYVLIHSSSINNREEIISNFLIEYNAPQDQLLCVCSGFVQ